MVGHHLHSFAFVSNHFNSIESSSNSQDEMASYNKKALLADIFSFSMSIVEFPNVESLIIHLENHSWARS